MCKIYLGFSKYIQILTYKQHYMNISFGKSCQILYIPTFFTQVYSSFQEDF